MKKLIILTVVLAGVAGGVFYWTQNKTEPVAEEIVAVEEEASDSVDDVSVEAEEVTKEVDCDLAVSNHQLYYYTSEDGLDFTKKNFISSLTSVPNLHYDEKEGNIVVSFQSFEGVSNLCDKMAYARIDLEGNLLTEIEPLRVESGTYFTGFDPTLVSVKDQLILVYTVRPKGKTYPCISVATANGDGPEDGFKNLEQIVWCSENDDENYMDPSAVVVGDELYLYIPSDKAMASPTPVSYFAKVDVSSSDASDWELTETGTVEGAGLFLLGEMVPQPDDEDCPYAFYGTVQNSIKRGCSEDGLSFSKAVESILPTAADPGVVLLPDGSYGLVYSASK